MKKRLAVLTLLCSAAFSGFSQTKGSLSLSFGLAAPVGQFGSKDANSLSSGLANTGYLADLSYAHSVKNPKFGLTAILRARINRLNNNASMAPFQSAYPDFAFSANTTNWKTAALLVGGYYSLPVSKKFDFRVEMAIGVAEAYFTKETVTGVRDSVGFGPTDLILANVGKLHATTFTTLAKTGLAYHLNDRCALLAHVDIWYLEPSFKNVTQTLVIARNLVVPGNLSTSNATSIQEYSETRNYTQNMTSVNLTLGLAYRL